MNIVKLDLSKGIKINLDPTFESEYDKTMYVNDLVGKLYNGDIKLESLNNHDYGLLVSELGSEVDIKGLYNFGKNNIVLPE